MSLDRIAALLAKAERTDNSAEAEAYLAKAQALATAASIDLAVARSRVSARQARQQPEARTVTIGEKGRRANRHLIALFIAVAHANDAQVDIAANSTYVIAYGMPSDLDVVEAMFASLAVQMTTAAQHWLDTGRWRGETYVATNRRTRRHVTKPHTAQTARVTFYRAYAARISERLIEVREQTVAEVAHSPAGSGTELVLAHKSAEIRDFHRRESKARGTWAGYSGAVRADRGSSDAAGRRAASSARLGEQDAIGASRAVEGSGA